MVERVKFGIFLFSILIGFGVIPETAHACSCGWSTLQDRYERSDNVFTAVITGGRITEEREAGTLGGLETNFEVTEVFKGTIPFDNFGSHANGNLCGISLQIGVEYLVFAPDSGEIGSCMGIASVSETPRETYKFGREYVAALRSFKSDNSVGLSEPWFFVDTEGTCRLVARFPHGETGSLAFINVFFVRRPPENVGEYADHPRAQPGFSEFTVGFFGGDDLSDYPLLLRASDSEYSARWTTSENNNSVYLLPQNDVADIVANLENADGLYMKSEHPEHGKISARASLAHAGDSVTRMLRCIRDD